MKVRKRDGRLVNFNESKIINAIKLASENTKSDNKITDEQLKNTVSFIKSSFEEKDKDIVDVDDVHYLVEKSLKKENKDVAKSYIEYRKNRELNRFKNLDITKKIFEKLNATNVVNQNANLDEFSFGGRKGEADSVLLKELALNYLISPKFAKNHNNNRIYIHDLDSYFVGMHNCTKRSTKFVTDKGVYSFEDFNDGDKVVVLTHNGEYKNATVKCYGKQKLNKITFFRNNVRQIEYFTENHRWIKSNGEETTNLSIGDKILVAPKFEDFDFDNATDKEKYYWCLGFVLGDGVNCYAWSHGKKLNKQFVRLRLCGDKIKYEPRFNIIQHSTSKMSNNDLYLTFTRKTNFLKKFPDLENMSISDKKALFYGLYDADGNHKGYHKGLLTTDEQIANFIEENSPMFGWYIYKCDDLTGQKTNYGIRGFTKHYKFLTKKNGTYKVINIEPFDEEDVWCLEVEDNHSFVLPNGIVTGNCLSLPIDDLLKNGMKTRQVFIRPANSLSTAMQLIAVAIQLQSLQQFGGVAVTHIDWTMIPYIRKSFFKHYNEGLKFIKNKKSIIRPNVENISILDKKIYKNKKVWDYAYEMIKKEIHQSVEGLLHNLNSLQSRSGNQLPFSSINYGTCTLEEGRLLTKEILECTINGVGNHATSIFPCQIFQLMNGVNTKEDEPNYDLFKLAIKCTSKRLYPNYVNCDWTNDQGYNKDDPRTYPSTMGAVRGDEFVSIKINGVEFNNISIKKAIEIIDSYTSNIEWINNESNKIGYTKYKQVKDCQIKCQNKWVDILNIEFNNESSPLKLYEIIFDKNGENQILHITEDHPLHTARGRIIATDLKIDDVIYDSVNGYGYKIISVKATDEKCNTYDFTTETDMFDLSGIVSHNCRTYSSTDINAESEELSHIKDGRGNIAPATIVLPTIAMESKKKMKDEIDEEKLIELFMKNLDDAITDCRDELIERFNYICSQNPKSASFMYENETFYGYKESEGIYSALKHGTLAIGQIGLAETLQILIGTDQCTNKGMELAKKIESLFKQRCAEFKHDYKLNFGVYYTPAEGLSKNSFDKFVKKYGLIENVTAYKDVNGKLQPRGYFTNSIHVPVWKEVSPFEKIDIESQLTNYSSAGCITYVEIGDNASNNLKALEDIVLYAKKKDIPYFALNLPLSHCTKCGCEENIGFDECCPKCGADKSEIEHLARVTGYLSTDYTHFNKGKQMEVKDRYVHVNKLTTWKKK